MLKFNDPVFPVAQRNGDTNAISKKKKEKKKRLEIQFLQFFNKCNAFKAEL